MGKALPMKDVAEVIVYTVNQIAENMMTYANRPGMQAVSAPVALRLFADTLTSTYTLEHFSKRMKDKGMI